MYYPTAPSLTANAKQNIKEVQEASPILCHSIPLVVFHSDVPEISPSVLTRGAEWAALLDRANAAHIPQSLTKTSAPDTAATAAVGSGKINLNHARPTDGQIASPSPSDDPESDAMSAASFGGNNGDSEYAESAGNSPTSLANRPDLEGYIRELETMHKFS